MVDKREKLRSRLKDVLWGLRQRYPSMAMDIDKVIPFIAFNKILTECQLLDILTGYSIRNDASYTMVTLKSIQSAIRSYYKYVSTRKGLYTAHQDIRALEQILRLGFEAYDLVENEITGFEMKVK